MGRRDRCHLHGAIMRNPIQKDSSSSSRQKIGGGLLRRASPEQHQHVVASVGVVAEAGVLALARLVRPVQHGIDSRAAIDECRSFFRAPLDSMPQCDRGPTVGLLHICVSCVAFWPLLTHLSDGDGPSAGLS